MGHSFFVSCSEIQADVQCCSSYSRLLAYESARILWRLGCDVRVFDPNGLPVKDDVQHDNHKVQELRDLSKWSDGHVWVSPEQHGQLVRRIFSFKVFQEVQERR